MAGASLTPMAPAADPTAGLRKLGPTEYAGLVAQNKVGPANFDQFFVRDAAGNIYLKSSAPGPAAAPGGEKVNVEMPEQLPSDLFTQSTQDGTGRFDIQALIEDNRKWQDAYLKSLQPTGQETDINNQLLAIRAQADQQMLAAQAGLNKIEDQPIAMPLVVGQQASLQRQANTQLQTLAAQEKNLVERLNLAQSSRQAQSQGLLAAGNFNVQNIQLAMQMQESITAQENAVLARAQALSTSARTTLTTILDKFQGLDMADLAPESQQQLLALAAQAGVPADVLVKGMETVKNQLMLDNLNKLQGEQLTPGQILNAATNLMATGRYANLADAIADVQRSVGMNTPVASAGVLITGGTGANRPDRNNNPLNVKLGGATQKWLDSGAATLESTPAADGGNFLVFKDAETGFAAAADLLFASGVYKGLTLDAAMRKWSGNGYGAEVAPQFSKDKTIDSFSIDEAAQLLAAMAKREGFTGQIQRPEGVFNEPPPILKVAQDFQSYLDAEEQAAGMSFNEARRKQVWDKYLAENTVVSPQGVVSSPAQEAAAEIMRPGSQAKLGDYPAPMQPAINAEIAKIRAGTDSSTVIGAMAASAGGAELSDASMLQLEKIYNLVGQINDLQGLFGDNDKVSAQWEGKPLTIDLSPITGIIRSALPWDTKAQQIKSQLNSIVPNLARGVFGEVGILTDKDVKIYSRTLPNLTSTKAVRDGVLALTVMTMMRSVANKYKTQAANGRDVSGNIEAYLGLVSTVSGLLASAGIENMVTDTGNLYIKTSEGWELVE